MRAVHSSKHVTIPPNMPGSWEKVQEFRRRLEMDEPLFQPGDSSSLLDVGDYAWADRGVGSHNTRARDR